MASKGFQTDVAYYLQLVIPPFLISSDLFSSLWYLKKTSIFLTMLTLVLMVLLLEEFPQSLLGRSSGSEESEQIVQILGGKVGAISHFVFPFTYKRVPVS